MNRKKISQLFHMRNEAVSEVLGTIILLSIVCGLFSVVALSVFNLLPTNSAPSANIFCQVNGDKIILTHMGGDELSLDTKIGFLSNTESTTYVLVGDYLNVTDKLDGKWSVGETIVYSNLNLLVNQIRVIVVDPSSNSLILSSTVPMTRRIFVTTLNAQDITINSTNLLMDYDFDIQSGSVRFTYHSSDEGWINTSWISQSGSGSYNFVISSLLSTKLYYFKAQLLYNLTIVEGEEKSFTTLCPVINTSVTKITPYVMSGNPLTITAAGNSDLDNVTLYYRWSDDNISWSGGLNEVKDPVDSNTSNIDGIADKGSETNFPNAQGITFDGNSMVIQEGAQSEVTNEYFNDVDIQSNLYPPNDIGTHSSFAEITDRDGIFDELTEARSPVTYQSAGVGAAGTGSSINPGYPAGLVSNDLMLLHVMVLGTTAAPSTPTNWNLLYGPYTTGGNDGRVWVFYKFSTGSESGTLTVSGFSSGAGKFARIYSFRNVALTSFAENMNWGTSTGSTIYDIGVTTTGTNELAVNLVAVGQDTNTFVDFTDETGGDWTEIVSEFSNSAGNDGTLQIQCATITSAGTIDGGRYNMGNSDPAGIIGFALKPINNNRLDLEAEWTSADYDETYEYLCIYGGTQDSEALQVDVWNGAVWSTVISDLSSGWNNVSVSSYLTSPNFEIRFVDTTQSSDTSQSTWQVEGVLLHGWSLNYQIDFEYQWTIADYDKVNEQLCFYLPSHTGWTENLLVNYWNNSAWVPLGTITDAGWSNFTATGLTSSTYSIQLKGANESGDPTQDSWNIDVIMLLTGNPTGGSHGQNWIIWSDANNPDTSTPWSWNFNFPKGAGYYEFYSIGNDIGHCESDVELTPVSADARCRKT